MYDAVHAAGEWLAILVLCAFAAIVVQSLVDDWRRDWQRGWRPWRKSR
jgi:uncharacterized membrane protein YiaA